MIEGAFIADDMFVVVGLPERWDAPRRERTEAIGEPGTACRAPTEVVVDGPGHRGLE